MLEKNKGKIFLDLINEKCPITFVKIKIALDSLSEGDVIDVRLKDKEAIDGLESSLDEIGYTILNRLDNLKGYSIFTISNKN